MKDIRLNPDGRNINDTGLIGSGSKSPAYRLTYPAPNRTLTDAEAGKVRAKIMQALEKDLGAKVRKAEG